MKNETEKAMIDFAFSMEGDHIKLVTPGWDSKALKPVPIVHDLHRGEAYRLLEELKTCLGAPAQDLLDDLESMARQHCYTQKTSHTYEGVTEINTTDSGAISNDAEALRTLAKLGRFRIVREHGRMVVGYWPENDPSKPDAVPARPLEELKTCLGVKDREEERKDEAWNDLGNTLKEMSEGEEAKIP